MDVREEPDHARFVIEVDGRVAGRAAYDRHGDRYVFTSTVVDDEFEGQGVGSRLARSVLDDMRQRGLSIVPLCPFIAGWIRRHHEYEDLIDADLHAELAAGDD